MASLKIHKLAFWSAGVTLTMVLLSMTLPVRESLILIEEESELIISGTTNVNKFNCHYKISTVEKPIPVAFEKQNNSLVFETAALQLENSCFDCGGKAINNDFRDLLKTSEYPNIALKLIEIENVKPAAHRVKARIRVTLAGVSRVCESVFEITEERDLHIKGKMNLCLSDFQLDPPKKALGIIRVNDEIQVNVNLKLTQL